MNKFDGCYIHKILLRQQKGDNKQYKQVITGGDLSRYAIYYEGENKDMSIELGRYFL